MSDNTADIEISPIYKGDTGEKGEKGDIGIGVPIGGTTGQQLTKKSATDYDFEWQTPTDAGDMLKSVYDSDGDGVVDNAEKVGGFTVGTNVPANAKFTDTIYTHPETHPASIILQDESNRFVSDAEKLAWNDKVDNSRVLTDVPVNAKFTDTIYTHPTSDGYLHVPATGTTNNGKVLKAGATAGSLVWGTDNDTITTINGKTGAITKADIVALGIPAQDTVVDISNKVDKVTGKGLSTNDYTNEEKNKLAGIATGANNYNLPTASTTVIGGVKVGTRLSIESGVLSATQQTANDFTTVLKNKLDGIEAEANKTTLSTSVTSTSTTTAATSSAVKSAYDMGSSGISKADTAQARADSAWTLANGKWTYNASTIQGVKVNNATKADVLEGTINNYVEKLTTTTGAINLNSGNVFHINATANTTFSITNAKAGAHSFTLIITMGGTERITLTFPASVKWQDGEVPDMTETNKTYILTFMTINSGTTWFGMEGGSF